ncbi:two-component system response regulator RR class II (RRII)-CheY-LuxR [Synechococcus sp. BIOS-U3-1]|uniref:response regulator transcription factor n=1 Tax=Synechococcus sp. BIOS-U3-1 TaxID=1400865 RepID=UPI001648A4EA|nr:response regulator transcription factor [Synechococcus sp. BIOS-U3-1]QNI59001.1 two-component system response regulator RR class II (RRII)-CheY-LuxR [Synechococcus sp. BIOS-U3-1]
MELLLDSRILKGAVEQAAQLLQSRRIVVCMGDRLALMCLCLTEPIRPVVLGAATTEDEGFELVRRTKPDLLICSSDLETGYGIDLIKRVHAESPSCQSLIVLVRETQAVVREAMDAYADGVMFKSSFGTGRGDFIQALQTLAGGQVYYPEEIRRLGSETPRPQLPPLVEPLSDREIEVVSLIALGLSNQAVADQLLISIETVKTHVVNATGKLGAQGRTQLVVKAIAYGLIDPSVS